MTCKGSLDPLQSGLFWHGLWIQQSGSIQSVKPSKRQDTEIWWVMSYYNSAQSIRAALAERRSSFHLPLWWNAFLFNSFLSILSKRSYTFSTQWGWIWISAFLPPFIYRRVQNVLFSFLTLGLWIKSLAAEHLMCFLLIHQLRWKPTVKLYVLRIAIIFKR